ncbi:carbonic anhydrase [Aureibacillus halotolerans]|uniref:Carbonic anhydrase n=1 Tax=Aureibacillus halotolerans TaxID=1508390 RepID=A0A4R6U8B3_9BACI|nr:carbonic anhydrase [Aureibacillus halotolerans]TDQ42788.1 hypothetical protein EV213_101217 [Aureibacillus halotolerans]
MTQKEFVTVINCMDGRVQESVQQWMQETHNAKYVDSITDAGPNKLILDGTEDDIKRFKKMLDVSILIHHSSLVAVVGHEGCAGNPAPEREQCTMTEKAAEIIQSWYPDVQVIALYATLEGQIKQLSE